MSLDPLDLDCPDRLTPTPTRFHRELRDALRELEPGLWQFFTSDDTTRKHREDVRVELLRSTYRLPRAAHARLYEIADEVARVLEVGAPLTIYQAQASSGLNAALMFVPDEAHVVLSGPVLDTLAEAELRALLGHELAHHRLWTTEGGSFRVADMLIERMASRGAPSHVQSALRFRRWTEIYADRGALLASGDLHASVSCLVKMSTELREVNPAAYLEQVDEVLGANATSNGVTHPEPFIRAFALRAWDEGGQDAEVERLVQGPCELESLDLVQQQRLTAATRALIAAILAHPELQTETISVHARSFFPDLPKGHAGPIEWPGASTEAIWPGESLAEYAAYVLLDFGLVDPDVEEIALGHVVRIARELDLHKALAKVAKKELRMTAATFAELEARGLARETALAAPPSSVRGLSTAEVSP